MKKNLSFIITALFLTILCGWDDVAFAQNNDQGEDQIFNVVETMPQFPGGEKGFQKWISRQVTYPADAVKNKIEGEVFISFVVGKKGDVENVRVVRGVNPLLDAEAIRVVKKMPTWIPGKQRGKNVRVSYTVPIGFKLGKSDSEETGEVILEVTNREGVKQQMSKAEFDEYCNKMKKSGDAKDKIISLRVVKDAKQKGKKCCKDNSQVFVIVEDMPQFPGGGLALQQWLSKQLEYPEDAKKKGIVGRVFVTFIVNESGLVEKAHVVKSVFPSLDKEALRVVNLMPKWTPGKQRGENVKVSYTVPINFALQ